MIKDWRMFAKENRKIVTQGETVIDNRGQQYIFNTLSMGRLSPKVVVSQPGFISRELFSHLFSDRYNFKELTKEEISNLEKEYEEGKEQSN